MSTLRRNCSVFVSDGNAGYAIGWAGASAATGSRHGGVAVGSGPDSNAEAGDGGIAVVEGKGVAKTGSTGQSFALGSGGTAVSGWRGRSVAGFNGRAVTGNDGTAQVGFLGTAQAGERGTLIFEARDDGRDYLVAAKVGQDGIKEDVPYCWEDGQIIEARFRKRGNPYIASSWGADYVALQGRSYGGSRQGFWARRPPR